MVAESTRENVDIVTGKEDTYGEMLDRAVKCALWLKKQGVKKGDIVAVSTHNHLDCFIPCLAAMFIGAIFNPWDYGMNTNLARHFLVLTEPKVIFANEQSAGVVLEAAKIETVDVQVVTFGEYSGTIPFAEILQGHDESEVEGFRCLEIENLKDTAIILFSSGTTGLPKGVQLSHKATQDLLENKNEFNLLMETPLWFSSLYWISGTLFNLKSISLGLKKYIPPEFEVQTAYEIIEKYKITWLMLSTSMSNRFIRYKGLQNYDLSSLKCLFVGGATLKKESQDLLTKNLPHTTVLQGYGMTELSGICAVQRPNATSGSCGTVCTNCELKIIDVETGTNLGSNQHGEICVKSPIVMNGYYKNPEATKEIIDNDGWLHTGDLGYYNEKGELFIVDRLKEIIKFRGYQIAPTQIENLLQLHPSVLEVAVVSIPHPTDDEHPIAFVSTVPNNEVTAAELMMKVENNLMDPYKLRGGVKFLPSLPHTQSGKISRKELKAMARSLSAR
ncbi:uncharacterized protein LOC116424392 isoform X2 [Nomia melanderi]|uniref:uncharacterized protein LOC116424392 isoform X2 n=1 Tax=Nomia melanderi TaxID=2448451 RepID=UPI003FCD96C2